MLKITPKYRIAGDWNLMGAISRPLDKRSSKEIMDTVEFLASKIGNDVEQMLPEIKKMNTKHLGLVSDTFEIANMATFGPVNESLLGTLSNGETVLHRLINKFIKASKNDHKALDFAQDIINNTDVRASKHFLLDLVSSDALENLASSPKFDAARSMIPEIAKVTLKPPYFINDSLENFSIFIKSLTSEKANADKVKLLKPFSGFLEKKFKSDCQLDVIKFVNSDVPNEKILDNMKSLGQMAEVIDKNGSNIDVVDFVTKNTNLR